MTAEEARGLILRELGGIAPEADLQSLPGDEPIRPRLELDSVDFLRFAIRLHEELGIEIPEADYSQLQTIDLCVAYVLHQKEKGTPLAKPAV